VNAKRRQRGYLLEILVAVALVLTAAALIGPLLPPVGQKIVAVIAAVVFIAGAYYDIVIPGWRPGVRLGPPWSWIVFGVVATVVALAAAAFVIYK